MTKQNINQIPVLPIVARSYTFVFMGLRPLLAAIWPWMGVVYIAGRAAGLSGGFTVEGEVSLGLWALVAANLVASSAVSVLCHRIIILSEWPAGLHSVSFGYREIYYLLALIGIGFAITITIVLFMSLIHIVGLGGVGASIGVIVALLISLVLYARISLAFPDLAVAESRLPWYVWEASHGHTARIIFGIVLSGVPLVVVMQQLIVGAAILQANGFVEVAMIVDFLALIVTFFAIMSSAAFLSFVYKFLIIGDSISSLPPTEKGERSNSL